VIAESTTMALVLANGDGHHMDGGWWVVMGVGMVLFWGLVILGIFWLVRELTGRGPRLGRKPEALELLDRRLAEGTISPEDYRERRAILAEPRPPADAPQ
jgi:putative membrane protein